MSIIEEIEQLNEKKRVLAEAPTTLMLQLKYVQPFPNGQKVALYFCPSIKKFFSFVYGKDGIIAEEDFSLMDKLKSINDIESIHFNDGSFLNINEECANNILELYNNTENKYEFEQYLLESDSNFLDALQYSVKQKQEEE